MVKNFDVEVEVTWYEDRITKALRDEIENGLQLAGIQVVNFIKLLISRGNKSGDNPSYPYEPPKVVTGRLRSSITFEVDMDPPTLYVGSNVEYARYLEFGTAKMKPRPFLRPGIIMMDKAIVKNISE